MLKIGERRYLNELPSVVINGEVYCASQIDREGFLEICRICGEFSERVMSEIARAFDDNIDLMEGIRRKSGEPYWHHPEAVALIGMLEGGNKDPDLVIASLLHDVVEDIALLDCCPRFVGQRERDDFFFRLFAPKYGDKVAKIVLAVTKPVRFADESDEGYQKRTYDRVLNLYPEVALEAARLKVCDRVANLRTEDKKDLERIRHKLNQTREVFAPVAVKAGLAYWDSLLISMVSVSVILLGLREEPEAA